MIALIVVALLAVVVYSIAYIDGDDGDGDGDWMSYAPQKNDRDRRGKF